MRRRSADTDSMFSPLVDSTQPESNYPLTGRIIVHAVNVHSGGGRILLLELLEALPQGVSCVLQADKRLTFNNNAESRSTLLVRWVAARVWDRLAAEMWLWRNALPGDIVLCFGNLPPLFKLKARVRVYVQNRYLVDLESKLGWGVWPRLRIALERLWLRRAAGHADGFDVQTSIMARLLRSAVGSSIPICIYPFSAQTYAPRRRGAEVEGAPPSEYEFIYPASGEPHKNHQNLIEAWKLLADEGLFPNLLVTLDEARFPSLCRCIERLEEECGVRIKNLGVLDHGRVLKLYNRVSALIYPSFFESFGLPLTEAQAAGLPVLAGECDYVRDILDPAQTFDPNSSASISQAVRRFMGVPTGKMMVKTAAEYVDSLLSESVGR